MEKTVFADAMVKVQLINGVVRMELVELQGADTAEAGNKTTPVTSTVILSKEGLAGLDNWDDIRMFGGG